MLAQDIGTNQSIAMIAARKCWQAKGAQLPEFSRTDPEAGEIEKFDRGAARRSQHPCRLTKSGQAELADHPVRQHRLARGSIDNEAPFDAIVQHHRDLRQAMPGRRERHAGNALRIAGRDHAHQDDDGQQARHHIGYLAQDKHGASLAHRAAL